MTGVICTPFNSLGEMPSMFEKRINKKEKKKEKKKKKEKEVILMKMHENKQSLILSRIFNNTQWLMKNLKMKSRLAR